MLRLAFTAALLAPALAAAAPCVTCWDDTCPGLAAAGAPACAPPPPAHVAFDGPEDGRVVLVDGHPVGTTPVARVALAPGEHTAALVTDGCHEAKVRSFTVDPGEERRLRLAEVLLTAPIEIVADVPVAEARVVIDGVDEGAAPGPLLVSACAKELQVTTADGRSGWAYFTLSPGVRQEVHVSLAAAPRTAPPPARTLPRPTTRAATAPKTKPPPPAAPAAPAADASSAQNPEEPRLLPARAPSTHGPALTALPPPASLPARAASGPAAPPAPPATVPRTEVPSPPAELPPPDTTFSAMVPVLEYACTSGELPACNVLAGLYEEGHRVRRDEEVAAALFEVACREGDGVVAACASLGAMYADGRGVGRDLERAADLVVAACEAGSDAACRTQEKLESRGDVAAFSWSGPLLDPTRDRRLHRHPVAGIGLNWTLPEAASQYTGGLLVELPSHRVGGLFTVAREEMAILGVQPLSPPFVAGRLSDTSFAATAFFALPLALRVGAGAEIIDGTAARPFRASRDDVSDAIGFAGGASVAAALSLPLVFVHVFVVTRYRWLAGPASGGFFVDVFLGPENPGCLE